MTPMGTGFAAEYGSVRQRLIDYHTKRSRGGVGLIVVGACCIDAPVGNTGFRKLLAGDDAKYPPRLIKLVDSVHAKWAKVSVQLAHAGIYTHSNRTGMQSDTFSHPLSLYQGDAAQTDNCLISQFISSAKNTRTDKFTSYLSRLARAPSTRPAPNLASTVHLFSRP